MGLESGTYVDDLVTTNPIGASDEVKQGDDHFRLIKSVLKNTLPNATRAFRFETVLTKTGAYPVVAADERALILADVSGGGFTVTLPLGSNVFAGFSVIVLKSDSGGNTVTVDGNGSETISGAATRSLTDQYQAEKYLWDGSEWKVISVTKVGTSGLVDGSVTTVKIAALAVDTAQLAASAVETAKINNSAVTLAKIANIATDRLLGRETSGSGVVEELTLGSGLDLASGAIRITPNGVDGTHIALGSDAQGDVMYYDGTDWVRLAKQSNTDVLTLIGGIPSWESAPLNIFRSSEQTWSANSFKEVAHGLGAIPDLASVHLVCDSTEGGYAVNDEIIVSDREKDAGIESSLAVSADATNIRLSVRALQQFVTKSGGGSFTMTTANWRLRFIAVLFA